MDKIPSINAKQIIKVLEKFNFVKRRQTGSHVVLKNLKTKKTIPVPIHSSKDLKKGTLFSILKQANISKKELLDNILFLKKKKKKISPPNFFTISK